MATTVDTPQQQSASAPIPRAVGSGAGLLALALLVYSLAGVVWGIFRPTITGTHVEGGAVSLDGGFGAQFNSFITFSLVTGILGLLLGLVSFDRITDTRGLGMMVWTGVVAFCAALAFLAVGDLTGTVIHARVEDPTALAEGETVTLVPHFNPHVGALLSPALAVLAYWVATLTSESSDWDEITPDSSMNAA